MPLGHHSVSGFIEANLRSGNLVRRENMIFTAPNKLTLKLTKNEELKLEEKAQEYNMNPSEFANMIVIQALKTISA